MGLAEAVATSGEAVKQGFWGAGMNLKGSCSANEKDARGFRYHLRGFLGIERE